MEGWRDEGMEGWRDRNTKQRTGREIPPLSVVYSLFHVSVLNSRPV